MALPRDAPSISSARYAIATAGTPAHRIPTTARPASSTSIDGDHGSASPRRDAATAEMTMTLMRPYRSDRTLTGMIANARKPVVSETVSADVVGETPKCCEKTGSIACTWYIAMKAAIPAANMATVALRNCREPAM